MERWSLGDDSQPWHAAGVPGQERRKMPSLWGSRHARLNCGGIGLMPAPSSAHKPVPKLAPLARRRAPRSCGFQTMEHSMTALDVSQTHGTAALELIRPVECRNSIHPLSLPTLKPLDLCATSRAVLLLCLGASLLCFRFRTNPLLTSAPLLLFILLTRAACRG